MKIAKQSILVLTASVMLLAACDGQQNAYNAQRGGITGGGGLDKSDIGTGLGAVGGAVIGSSFGKGNGRVVGGVLGGLLGAGIGHSIGSSLDRADMQYYGQASQSAFDRGVSGQAVPWRNPDSGNYGSITPKPAYQNNGQYCREFTQKINVGGKSETGYGTACRQPDGSWQVVSE